VERALQVINALRRDGLIQEYAIGGAMALVFYTEPVLTYDLDIFVLLPEAEMPILTLTPIYDRLASEGYHPEHEHVVLEGFPVQFLPAYNPLVDEAVREARPVLYDSVETRVVRPEHLAAIMLQTYRPKDRERLSILLDEAVIDTGCLLGVLERHGLSARWEEYRRGSPQ